MRERLVSQLTIHHIWAIRSMKAYTTHYTLSRTRKEKQLSQHEPFSKAEPEVKKSAYRSLWTVINNNPCCFMLLFTNSEILPCILRFDNIAGQLHCGLWFHSYTFSPLMGVEESHGVSDHQRQLGTSFHCTIAWTSENWFVPAGTCPCHKTTNASVIRTVKSAYCTNLLSHQISREHL